jgi:hypothetical protein
VPQDDLCEVSDISSVVAQIALGRHYSAMMEALAELQRLRQQLREAIARLMHEAENDSESLAALTYTKLASECQKLDREIELRSKDILKEQPPEGVA